MKLPPVPRIGYPEAIKLIVNELASGVPMSISSLSKKLNIDRRTVGKVIDMLIEVQAVLSEKQLETERVGRRFVIRFRERTARARNMLGTARVVVRRKASRRKRE
ncbi:MAG: hypothetical protein EAX95_11505 [Candidatus Thorarchaeota archaeon]|nr:hypothetical protein [Candidatus Thorarchaeota archaeon]